VNHKVALEKDEAGKNMLKIIVGSFSHKGPAGTSTQRRRSNEATMVLLNPTRLVL
jgi:hypothetical protein